MIIYRTDEGIYMLDFATQRARFKFLDSKMTWYIIGMGLANVVLTTITILNIKKERFERRLMQEDKEREERRRRKKEAKGADEEEENDGEDGGDDLVVVELSFKQKCCAVFLNCIKFTYLRGGSFWSYIDLMMNITCFMSIFFKYFYVIYVDRVIYAAI